MFRKKCCRLKLEKRLFLFLYVLSTQPADKSSPITMVGTHRGTRNLYNVKVNLNKFPTKNQILLNLNIGFSS